MAELQMADAFHSLGTAEIHVWYARSSDFDACSELRRVLSAAEMEIAARFLHREDRRTYELAHGVLRHVLGRYLGRDPAEVQFDRRDFGKPFLPGSEFAFNLSHSGDRAAIAVARSEVGVDLEHVKSQLLDWDFVNECLTASEYKWMTECTDNMSRAFYRLWALKEAAMKADGRGLSIPCRRAEVRMGDENGRAKVTIGDKEWVAFELSAGPDFCLAVTSDGVRDVHLYDVKHLSPLGK